MNKHLKSLVIFLIIYVIFWLIMWLWAIPSTMVAGGSAIPYYIAFWGWLIGVIVIPIIFGVFLYLQKKKQKTK